MLVVKLDDASQTEAIAEAIAELLHKHGGGKIQYNRDIYVATKARKKVTRPRSLKPS